MLAMGGIALVAMQFRNGDSEAPKVAESGSKLKKTLTNAGLYPTPEKTARLQKTASGSMAAFTNGDSSVVLTKGGGEPL